MLLSRHHNAGQSQDIKIANRSVENVAQFKYLGMRVTNQNLIQEEIKKIFNLGNAYYYSVQNFCPLNYFLKTLKITIYTAVLYGCETWYLTLTKEHGLKMFKNRVLRKVLGPRRDELTRDWRKLHNEDRHKSYSSTSIIRIKKRKAIPITGHGGLWGCEVLSIPRCLDNWLTDGGKVVSPKHQLLVTPQKHYFSASGTHFC
jgi:hypothetical protein